MHGTRALLTHSVLVAGATLSCGQDLVFVEAPAVEGARAFLYAFEQTGNIEVRASTDGASDLGFTPADWYLPEEPLDITRLALRESLETLKLEPGVLLPSAPPNRPVRELDPIQIDVTALISDVDRLRLQPGQASEGLLRFLIPRPSECPSMRGGAFVAVASPIEAVSLDESRAIALAGSEILLFHADERVERWPLPSGESEGAIALSDLGRAWVATSSAVRPFDPELGTFGSPALAHGLARPPIGLMVREGGPELQVWLVSRAAEVLHHRGARANFQVLEQFPSNVVRADELGSFSSPAPRFAPLGGEDFLLAGEDIGVVMERKAGRTRLLSPSVMGKGFGGILPRADGTVVLSESLNGTVYLYDRGVMDSIGQKASEMSAVARLDEERFVFVTGLGIGGVFFLDARSCPDESLPDWVMLRTMARLGDGLLVGGEYSSREQGLGILHLEP